MLAKCNRLTKALHRGHLTTSGGAKLVMAFALIHLSELTRHFCIVTGIQIVALSTTQAEVDSQPAVLRTIDTSAP